MRVLGIDPGSAATGWALVISEGSRYRLEEAGVIRTRPAGRAVRLARIHRMLSELVARLRPDCAAVESSFSGQNPRSGLALAESRGAILAALGTADVEVHDYTPAAIKNAIVGHGTAEKQQIIYMVMHLLGVQTRPAQDAADAMAVALTHLHTHRWHERR